MLASFRKLSLPQQLSWGALFSVISATALMLFTIFLLFDKEISKIAIDFQQEEVSLVAKELETNHRNVVARTQLLSDIFVEQFSALEVDTEHLIPVGAHNSPTAYLNGEVLNLNFSLMDKFTRTTGATATIFIRNGDDFLRITTSLKKENGDRAFGTYLGKNHPGYQRLISGENYGGPTFLFGKNYMTRYVPIQKNGQTIAVLYIGVGYDEILSEIKSTLSNRTFGKSGYVYVTDTGAREAQVLIHPTIKVGTSLYDALPDLRQTFAKMYQSNAGAIHYTAQIVGKDAQPRSSTAVFHKVEGWDWVVAIKFYSDDYQEVINANIMVLTLYGVIGALVLSFIIWFIIRRALAPLEEVTTGLKRLGEGDLTFRFATMNKRDSKNEIDLLKRDVTAMRDGLEGVITQVLHSSTQLAQAARSISSANNELTKQAQLSENECIQVASAIEQIAVSIEMVAQNANEVSEATVLTDAVAKEGNKAVIEVNKTVGQLSSAFNQASSIIQEVEENSNSIGAVVDVINAIAEQTNLLALNAAIEAARAGEQGRGFAVVADEVRNLAQRTQQSTEEIRTVVERLQTNSRTAVQGMEQGSKQVADSVEKVSSTRELIQEIQSSIEAIEGRMSDVAAATEEQSVAAAQIRQIAQSLKASSLETFKQAEHSQQHSNSISSLASQLQTDLSRFKL